MHWVTPSPWPALAPAARQPRWRPHVTLPGCVSHRRAADYEPASRDSNTQRDHVGALSRRVSLGSLVVAAAQSLLPRPDTVAAAAAPDAAAPDAVLYYVRPGPDDAAAHTYGSIADAVAAAPPGATVRVAGGFYSERVVVSKPLTLEAETRSGGGGGNGSDATVTLSHDTEAPYEAALQIDAPDVHVRNLVVRHTSPSIAANYAILVRSAGSVTLDRCDVRSSTGSGLGVEGGCATARLCKFSECQRHGVALYGDLLGSVTGATVLEDCTLAGNKENGLLMRDGADAAVRGCTVASNGGLGIMAVDSSLQLLGCEVRGNRKGALKVERSRSFEVEATALDAPPVFMDT